MHFVSLLLLYLTALSSFGLPLQAMAQEPPLLLTPSLDSRSSLPPDALLPTLTVNLPTQAVMDEAPTIPTIDLIVPPESLWQRIRNGFGMADLHVPQVADRQSWYLNRPEMLRRIFERGGRYLYHIVEELEKRGMPTELALLPMVESAFNPRAVSSARAMGIWQFIPSTGKTYKLDQNWWVDERRDIVASTDAALNYLQNIYEMHGDWHLALASYNWGENAVARAITKNEAKGLPTDYGSLTMPAETRYYVPKLQALKNIIANPDLFGLHLPLIPNQPYFETVMKPPHMDIAVAARLAEISVEEFVSLNPAYQRPVMDGNQGSSLVLPADKVDVFRANLERHEARDIPLSNWQTYQMKKGDTLDKIAAHHSIGTASLKQINGIGPRLKTGPGFNLLVPRPGSRVAHDLMARILPPVPPAPPAKPVVRPTATKKSPAANRTATKAKSARKPETKAPAQKRKKR
jgi:membrane-bound lytic murein transglycosylase D